MKRTLLSSAILLCCILMGTSITLAQEGNRVLGSTTGLTFQNAFVLPISDGHYAITNTTNGTVVVMKQNHFNSTVWSFEYGINTMPAQTNVAATSCTIDGWGDIVIVGNRTVGAGMISRPFLFRISSLDGSLMNQVVYNDLASPNTILATSVKVGIDNNYYFTTVEYAGNSYANTNVVCVQNTNPVNILAQRSFTVTNSQLGIYDLVEIGGGVWAMCGPTGAGVYNSAVFTYDFGTNNITNTAQYNLINGDDDFDKITRDPATGAFYLASVLEIAAGNDDIGVVRLDAALNIMWHTRYAAANFQRAGSLEIADDGSILVGGRSTRNTGLIENGFAISLTPTGVTNWQKAPQNMGPTTGVDYFRTVPSGSDFYYAGNTGGANIFTSKETLAAQPSPCFQTLDYTPSAPNEQRNPLVIQNNPGAFTSAAFTFGPPPAAPVQVLNRCRYCYEQLQSSSEVITINTTTLTPGYYKWGVNNQGTKYYVEGDLLFGDGCILDITGVDVVFAEGASITMLPGSELRINNSVLRSCFRDGTWQGFIISYEVEAEINNSVFKQAEEALVIGHVSDPGANNTRVTNNEFTNCQTAIKLRNITVNNGAITNNVIYVDDLALTYMDGNMGVANQYAGVYATGVDNELLISQNQFLYSRTTGSAKELYGIYSTQSQISVTENTFTNCHRAIDMQSNLSSNIENNDIEITQLKDVYDYQIRLSNHLANNHTRIAGNHLTNYDSHRGTAALSTAIYADFSQSFEILENEINGFNVGIHLEENIADAQVYGNTIENGLTYGVYAVNCQTTAIKCNTIEMDYSEGMGGIQFPIGIAYKETQSAIPNNLDIRGNCIFNTSTAVALIKQGDRGNLPNVENNYLYNYVENGIYIENFAGSIGTGANAPQAGRNIFVAHNLPGGALDINNVTFLVPVTEDGNYNVISVSGVTMNSANTAYSTASCSNYFDNQNPINRFEDLDKCDLPYSPDGGTLVDASGGVVVLRYEETEDVGGINDSDIRLRTWAMAERALFDHDVEEQKLVKAVNDFEQDASVKALFTAYKHVLNGEYVQARMALDNSMAADYLSMTKCRLQLMADLYESGLEVSPALLDNVVRYTQQADYFANELRVALTIKTADVDYPFKKPELTLADNSNAKVYSREEVLFNVYPNPANGSDVSIDLSTPGYTSSVIYVRDVSGRVVTTEQVNISGGSVNLSIEGLTNGAYFVSIETEEGVIASEKLIITR